jgi:hypothetical protein
MERISAAELPTTLQRVPTGRGGQDGAASSSKKKVLGCPRTNFALLGWGKKKVQFFWVKTRSLGFDFFEKKRW